MTTKNERSLRARFLAGEMGSYLLKSESGFSRSEVEINGSITEKLRPRLEEDEKKGMKR